MKKIVPILFICTIIASCNGTNILETKEEKEARLDSFSRATYGMSADEKVKEMVNSTLDKSMLDTIGLSKSPVKILKYSLVKREYSNYRDIRLTYKNISNKKISAIKFRWKGINAFGDPADMGGSYVEGYGGGFSDTPLGVGRTETSEWGILSEDAKKVLLAWATEVAFSDGTKWELKK